MAYYFLSFYYEIFIFHNNPNPRKIKSIKTITNETIPIAVYMPPYLR